MKSPSCRMGFCVSVVRPACRYASRWRCACRGYGSDTGLRPCGRTRCAAPPPENPSYITVDK
ncbi:hypothetical protein IUJ34_12565 [Klebsiella pneumoniae subsp. pneumoniae]|uniref:Uncharacterized protein n=1 Tax=Klebsiella pneumoniae subsp. pneumoniae TaxID=72407 RepID=A0A7S9HF12_KLEPN|nr:hypothetical protein IUJ34_12565 [Klebsiella pneumoniae subsp. pneumoniae]